MDTTDFKEEFLTLSTKFLFFNCKDNSCDINASQLNLLLNELNGFDYKSKQIIDTTSATRLIQSFSNIPICEETLVIKSCFLIVSLINKQKIVLPKDVLINTITWLLESLKLFSNCDICDVLDALQVLFRSNTECVHICEKLIIPNGILTELLQNPLCKRDTKKMYDGNTGEEILLSVIFCIESILLTLTESKDFKISDIILSNLGDIILNKIYTIKNEKFGEVRYNLIITSALNCCQSICSLNKTWTKDRLGELLGYARAFIMRGLPNINDIQPQKLLISQQALLDPETVSTSKGGKIIKVRKSKPTHKAKKVENQITKTENEKINRHPYSNNDFYSNFDSTNYLLIAKTSDSEYSESETNRIQSDRQKQTKLRFAALTLIGVISRKIEKQLLFGYWHCIFNCDNLNLKSISLLNCVLRDPSPKCRMAALQTISLLFHGSKQYLLQAENSDKAPTSYMPFSEALGNMIVTVYNTITQALSNESSLPVLTQVLKCLTILIQSTPFHRLKFGIATEFVKYIRHLLYHKDVTIKVASLKVMGFLLSINDITPEISDIIGIPKDEFIQNNKINQTCVEEQTLIDGTEEIVDSDYEEDELINVYKKNIITKKEKSVTMSWLLEYILQNLSVLVTDSTESKEILIPIRIECLQVLTAMGTHFLLINSHLSLISKAIKLSVNDPLTQIKLYGAKCVDVIGHSINNYLIEQDANPDLDIDSYINFWLTILPCLVQQIQDTNQTPFLRSICCDALANIGVNVFERLPHHQQMLLITLLSSCGCGEESIVRAAAVRALAVYVLFPTLSDNMCYVENTSESILRILKDSNLQVRIKASWSLGNITDAFIANIDKPCYEVIGDDLLKSMIENTIDISNDNDKVRSHANRALGNLLRLINDKHLVREEWQGLCIKAIEKLIHNSTIGGNMKVKWNACYAIGNFLKNPYILDNAVLNWQDLVYPALCSIIIHCPNYKVRINGAIALSIPKSRKYYNEKNFMLIWESLLLAFEQTNNLIDFNEYKHRDNLIEQLCLTISHIIKIINNNDLIIFNNKLIPHIDIIKTNWQRVLNRLLPEKTSILLETTLFINKIKNDNLSQEQKFAAQNLLTCFSSLPELT